MPLLILGALLAILAYLPAVWVRRVMKQHGAEIEGLAGTGGELAKHLIKRFELSDIEVEETGPFQDHFDPAARKVRLSPDNFHGKSLTAVAVAAHEVGHAMQFHRSEKIFELRKRYLPTAARLSKAGIGLLMVLPVVGFAVRSPIVVGGIIAASLLLQLAGALAYLIILPEEWDASFNKAMPVLIEGDYVDEKQIPAVRKILKAAALTYFASALANMLNIGRWFMILRR
ncbi:MAG TPA: Zn-dependent protease [Gammaproteobacteria bacterium]|nr:Zn-dependent protease [Gammaproteobacteria bacterium]